MKYPELSKIAYWEYHPDEDGYYYYIQFKELDYHITPDGVSVIKEDKSSTMTNIDPVGLFGNVPELTDEQLLHIIKIPVEGDVDTEEEMKRLYEQFKKEQDGK